MCATCPGTELQKAKEEVRCLKLMMQDAQKRLAERPQDQYTSSLVQSYKIQEEDLASAQRKVELLAIKEGGTTTIPDEPEIINGHTDAINTNATHCYTCNKPLSVGQLVMKFTSPEMLGERNTSHHVDCIWPASPHAMISNKEAEQIKLELLKCPLQESDKDLLHTRLDRMANNYNGHMWGYL